MIGIKYFEMPKNCARCDLCRNDEYGCLRCMLLDEDLDDWDDFNVSEERFEDCPLVEIKGVGE